MGFEMILMLNADGSGEFDGEDIQYTAEGNKLKIVQDGIPVVYTFSIQGNSLTLSGGDLDDSITFKKAGGNATSEPSPATKSVATSAKNIIGIWSNYGETIEFKSNGQCIYIGQTYTYQASGNQITLQTSQGNLPVNYVLNGNELILTINGQRLTYKRGQAVASSVASQGQSGAGGKKVAGELVGKWCYINVTSTNTGGVTSDECIILNADGSYEYHSERSMSTNTNAFWAGTNSQSGDRGTWSFDGQRIYYTSQTGTSGSFQLQKRNHPKNGDPMIVLDGKAYVTFYQKSPW